MTNPTDIVVFGTENTENTEDRPPAWRWVLLLTVAASMFLVGHQAGDHHPPAPTAPPVTSGIATPQSRLIVPRTAVPGQLITVLAYRNAHLCGPAELRFDGTPMRHRLAWFAGPVHPDRIEMALILQVPGSAKAGRHEIELWGPVRGGPIRELCADRPEHQARLDTATITVAGSPRQ